MLNLEELFSFPMILFLSFLYVCMVNTIYLLSFVETPRKFIIAELSIRKLGTSSVLIILLLLLAVAFVSFWLIEFYKDGLVVTVNGLFDVGYTGVANFDCIPVFLLWIP